MVTDRKWKLLVAVGLSLILALAMVACSDRENSGTANGDNGADEAEDLTEGKNEIVPRLPGMNELEHSECDVESAYPPHYLEAETFEDWVSGAYAVVIGTVDDVTAVRTPAHVHRGMGERDILDDAGECDRVDIALDVTLRDVDFYFGEEDSEVTFRIGDHQIREQFTASPFEEDGTVLWKAYSAEEQSLVETQERGIFEGMRIGTRLYRSPRAEALAAVGQPTLTTAGTWLFQELEDGIIHFQGHDGRPSYCPGEVGYYLREEDDVTDGITTQELHDGIAPGPGVADAAVSDRPYIETLWRLESTPLHAFRLGATSSCVVQKQASSDSNGLCPPGEEDTCPDSYECIDGECVAL